MKPTYWTGVCGTCVRSLIDAVVEKAVFFQPHIRVSVVLVVRPQSHCFHVTNEILPTLNTASFAPYTHMVSN